MAFCTKCGAKLEDGAAFCTSCGAKVGTTENTTQNTTQSSNSSDFEKKANDAINNVSEKFTNTADYSTEFDSKDIEDNKIISLFAYLGLLFLVPLLAAPNSKFARFHANQGIVLFIAWVICGAVNIIPILGQIACVILSIILTIISILGIVNAVGGKAKELPFIGKYKILK